MNGDSWNIVRAEGGFIVYETPAPEDGPNGLNYKQGEPRVFTDSAALLNYLHNKLV